MDKELLEKYIEMADHMIDPFQMAQTKLHARIAHQLTNCVAQLKRQADKMEPTKHIVDICPNCMSLPSPPPPSCNGALRTAVREFIDEVDDGAGYCSNCHSFAKLRAKLILEPALAASPKPRDESDKLPKSGENTAVDLAICEAFGMGLKNGKAQAKFDQSELADAVEKYLKWLTDGEDGVNDIPEIQSVKIALDAYKESK